MSTSLRCPFCGKNNAAIDTLNYASGKPAKFRVQCQECLAATHWCDSAEQAWVLWGRRAEAPPARKRREPVNAVLAADVFIYRDVIYARVPKTGLCYQSKRGSGEKPRRVNKADFAKAYSDCLAICSAELKAAEGAGV